MSAMCVGAAAQHSKGEGDSKRHVTRANPASGRGQRQRHHQQHHVSRRSASIEAIHSPIQWFLEESATQRLSARTAIEKQQQGG